MRHLDLESAESDTLRSILEGYKDELLLEISHTDTREYRDTLRERSRIVDDLLARLR